MDFEFPLCGIVVGCWYLAPSFTLLQGASVSDSSLFPFPFINHSLSFACFPLQQFWFWRQLLDGAHLSSSLPHTTLPSPSATFLVCCALYCLPLSFSNPFPFFSFSLHVCHRFGFLLDHENVCGAHQRTTHCKNGVWFRVASGGAPSNSPSLSIDDHSVSDVYSL